MNLPNLLAHHARKFPDKEAIVTPTERLTYKEWDRCVNKLAHSLRELGISRGDKVVLHMPNTKEFLITYFAVQRLGALIVPINARFVAHEIDYILENCEARMFITHNLVFNQVAGLGKKAGVTFVKTGESETGWYSWDGLLEKGSEEEIYCPLHEDDEASILYTSGTTGKPKGVVFTYRNILDVASMICIEMDVKPDSRILHMMPLSHSAPLHLFMGRGSIPARPMWRYRLSHRSYCLRRSKESGSPISSVHRSLIFPAPDIRISTRTIYHRWSPGFTAGRRSHRKKWNF